MRSDDAKCASERSDTEGSVWVKPTRRRCSEIFVWRWRWVDDMVEIFRIDTPQNDASETGNYERIFWVIFR